MIWKVKLWVDKMTNKQVVNVFDAINEFQKKEDGTYNIITGEEMTYPDGYQVSFVRPEAFDQLSPKDWDNITNFYCKYFKSIAHIGVYDSSAEVSFHSLSIDKAVKTMREYNQESILDWEQKKKYPNPDLFEHWFIINNSFDEKKVVKYEKILKEIQCNNK